MTEFPTAPAPTPFRVRRLHAEAKLPHKAGPFEAGFDLHAPADCYLRTGQRAVLALDVAVEIPAGHVGLLKDRSSLASKGVHVLGGVIDSTYRGELKVVLHNLGEDPYRIYAGDRVVQLLVVPLAWLKLVEVTDLSPTERGTDGFGSTGK